MGSLPKKHNLLPIFIGKENNLIIHLLFRLVLIGYLKYKESSHSLFQLSEKMCVLLKIR